MRQIHAEAGTHIRTCIQGLRGVGQHRLLGGINLWTTCFCHLGHILHDWAKCLRLDTHDNIQGARPKENVQILERNVQILERNVCDICISAPPPAVSSFMSPTPISYSKQTDNWLKGIEVFNENKTDRRGNEILVPHTNSSNNHIYIKALL